MLAGLSGWPCEPGWLAKLWLGCGIDKYKHFPFVQCLCYNSICVPSSVSDGILCRVDNNLFPRSAILFPPGCRKIYLHPSSQFDFANAFHIHISIHQNCSFISLWKYEKDFIHRFWLNRLTTRARWRRESEGWNKLIFVQQRTFITHSADDIFPFSYKIESHSPNHTCSIPLVRGKSCDETNLSYQLLVPGCQPSLLFSSEDRSLSCIYVFRQFTRLKRSIINSEAF